MNILWIIYEQSDWFAIGSQVNDIIYEQIIRKKLYMIEQNVNKLWIK